MIAIQTGFPSIVKNPHCNRNIARHVHECPFCRCRSLQSKSTIVIQRKPRENFRIFPFMGSINNSIQRIPDNKIQNVYYRTFNSPKRGRLQPRSCSRKIVIQYSSPQRINQNTITIQSLPKPLENNAIKIPFVSCSSNGVTPRTIYTDANTPPKSKYLQRKHSRKFSQQKHQYANPFRNLTLVQSEKVKKPPIQYSHHLLEPYKALEFNFRNQQSNNKSQKKEQNDLLWMKKLDFLEQIPQTSTSNWIKKTDSTQNSATPSNSLVQTKQKAPPYERSQTTHLPYDNSKIKQFITSMDQIVQFIDETPEINLTRKSSKPLQNSRDQSTPKYIDFRQKQNNKNQQKFERIQGKYKTYEKETENQLIYSQSNQITIQNYGGSLRNIYDDQSSKMTSYQTTSDQNIRQFGDINKFQKKRDTYVVLQISDSLQTPKSKYITEENNLNKSKKNIKFNFVQDQRRSKLFSGNINENIVEKQAQILKLQRMLENMSILSVNSPQSLDQNVDNQEFSRSFFKQDSLIEDSLIKNKQVEKAAKPILSQDYQQKYKSFQGNQSIREQGEQLKLNYDYYSYRPTPVFPSFG